MRIGSFFVGLFLFSFCNCGMAGQFFLRSQDTSKIEAYTADISVNRRYVVLGVQNASECETTWKDFCSDERDYLLDNKALDTLKQLAKVNYGDRCDAIINIRYAWVQVYKSRKCQPFESPSCCARLKRWCVKVEGQVVEWLDKSASKPAASEVKKSKEPTNSKDPPPAHEPMPAQYYKYEKAIAKIGKIEITEYSFNGIILILAPKFIKANIPMAKWNAILAVTVYLETADAQASEVMENISVNNGKVYLNLATINIPNSVSGWLWASLEAKSQNEYQIEMAQAQKSGQTDFYKNLKSAQALEKYKKDFDKRLKEKVKGLIVNKRLINTSFQQIMSSPDYCKVFFTEVAEKYIKMCPNDKMNIKMFPEFSLKRKQSIIDECRREIKDFQKRQKMMYDSSNVFYFCSVKTGYCDNQVPGDPQILECIRKEKLF